MLQSHRYSSSLKKYEMANAKFLIKYQIEYNNFYQYLIVLYT